MGMLNNIPEAKHQSNISNTMAAPFDISFDTDEEAMVLALSFGQEEPMIPSRHNTPIRVSPGILIHSDEEVMTNLVHA